jgi:hypothetical protein
MQQYKHDDPNTKLVIKATHKVTRAEGMVVLLASDPPYDIDEETFELEISQDPIDWPIESAPPPAEPLVQPNASGTNDEAGKVAGSAFISETTPLEQANGQQQLSDADLKTAPIIDMNPLLKTADEHAERAAETLQSEGASPPVNPPAEVQSTPPAVPVDDVAPAAAG